MEKVGRPSEPEPARLSRGARRYHDDPEQGPCVIASRCLSASRSRLFRVVGTTKTTPTRNGSMSIEGSTELPTRTPSLGLGATPSNGSDPTASQFPNRSRSMVGSTALQPDDVDSCGRRGKVEMVGHLSNLAIHRRWNDVFRARCHRGRAREAPEDGSAEQLADRLRTNEGRLQDLEHGGAGDPDARPSRPPRSMSGTRPEDSRSVGGSARSMIDEAGCSARRSSSCWRCNSRSLRSRSDLSCCNLSEPADGDAGSTTAGRLELGDRRGDGRNLRVERLE